MAIWARHLELIHPRASILLSDELVNRAKYYKWETKRGNSGTYKVRRLEFGGSMTQWDIVYCRVSASHWPIRQFSVPECSWYAFFDTFIAQGYKNSVKACILDSLTSTPKRHNTCSTHGTD